MFSALVLVLLLTPGSTPAQVARSDAESNAKTPAGKRYEGVLISKVEDWLRPVLERCVRGAPETEIVSFDALLRISAQGKADEVILRPETSVAKCVEPDFRGSTYPRPPQPDWWVRVEVRLK